MAWQGLKLNLKVSQKQILTPGLVQMVSVLALNRLELREMINQEMIANPVLEELSEEPTQSDKGARNFRAAFVREVFVFAHRAHRSFDVAAELDDFLGRCERARGKHHWQSR